MVLLRSAMCASGNYRPMSAFQMSQTLFQLLGQLARPLLLETGMATAAIFEDVFARALREIHAPDFHAICPIQVVGGIKH